MSGRSMSVSILVGMKDAASSGINALIGRLKNLGGLAPRLAGMMGGMFGFAKTGILSVFEGVGAVIGFALRNIFTTRERLRDLAELAGHTGDEISASIIQQQQAYSKLAVATGHSFDQIADQMERLLKTGMSENVAQQVLPAVMRTSIATGMEVNKVSDIMIALQRNMGLTGADAEGAFGRLMAAAKRGRMEITGMVSDMPKLTEALGRLGIRSPDAFGRIGAAMVAAKRVTGNDAAAQRSANALFEGVDTKRFRAAGIDIEGVMRNADKKNIPRIDALIQKIASYTGITPQLIERMRKKNEALGMPADLAMQEVVRQLQAGKLGERLENLLGDKDGMAALVGVMQNLKQYNADTKADNEGGQDAFEKAYADKMKSAEQQWKRFKNLIDGFTKRIGLAVTEAIIPMIPGLEQVQAWMIKLDEKFPGLTNGIILIVGGFVALFAVLALWTMIAPVVTGAFFLLTAAISLLATVVYTVIAGAFSFLATVLAGLFSPLGLLVVAFAFLAAAIIANWDQVSAALMQGWQAIKQIFSGALQFITGVLTGDFGSAFEGLKTMFGGLAGFFEAGWNLIAAVFHGGISVISSLLGGIDQMLGTNLKGGFDSMMAGVEAAMQQGWESIKQIVSGAVQFITGVLTGDFGSAFEGLKTMFGGLGGIIQAQWNLVTAIIQGGIDAISGILGGIDKMFGTNLKGGFDSFIADVKTWPEKIAAELLPLAAKLAQAGTQAMQGLWDGMKAKFNEMLDWVKKVPERISGYFNFNGLFGGADKSTPAVPPAPGTGSAPTQSYFKSLFGGDKTAASPVPGAGSVPTPGASYMPTNYSPTGDKGFAPVVNTTQQEVKVGGRMDIHVDGPATVANVTSTNPQVPISANSGDVHGRA